MSDDTDTDSDTSIGPPWGIAGNATCIGMSPLPDFSNYYIKQILMLF
jgi:hypothetical protein